MDQYVSLNLLILFIKREKINDSIKLKKKKLPLATLSKVWKANASINTLQYSSPLTLQEYLSSLGENVQIPFIIITK